MGDTLKLLIVDDDPLVRRALARRLHGCQVTEAAAVDEALQLLEAHTFDGLLVDYGLGASGTGLDVLRAAQTIQPTALRALISGRRPAEFEQEELELVGCFLLKPFTQQQITDLLGSITPRDGGG